MTALTRDARAEDLTAIDRLFRASFTGTFAHLYSEREPRGFPRPSSRPMPGLASSPIRASPSALPSFTASPSATSSSARWTCLSPPSGWRARAKSTNSTCSISAKGSGIADELMHWAIGKARALGGSELFLSVFIDNHRARRFYERHGFEYVGPYHFMVGDQADEDIIMSRPL